MINTEEGTLTTSPWVAVVNSLNPIYIGDAQICSPVHCCPEKANLVQKFRSSYLMERFFECCTTQWTPGSFESKNSGIIRVNY